MFCMCECDCESACVNVIVRVHATAWYKDTNSPHQSVGVRAGVCVCNACVCVCNACVCVLHEYTLYTRIEIETQKVRERATKECTCLYT
mmetsp:Transcript_53529/g.86651  ORF Transcript_53529/g.86651 Transcript_53529/m.86651 type:complete len:89 (-) Transcript_53529:469-735(-)